MALRLHVTACTHLYFLSFGQLVTQLKAAPVQSSVTLLYFCAIFSVITNHSYCSLHKQAQYQIPCCCVIQLWKRYCNECGMQLAINMSIPSFEVHKSDQTFYIYECYISILLSKQVPKQSENIQYLMGYVKCICFWISQKSRGDGH